MANQTPGLKALLNLTLLLDTLDLEHPDIVGEWLGKLYAELSTIPRLKKVCKALLKSLESWHRTLMTVDGMPLSEIPKQFEELVSVQAARRLLGGVEDD